MPDVQVLATGTLDAPLDYLVKDAQEIIPRACFAHFDGTGAAGAFLPTLQIISDSGHTIAEIPMDSSVAAGSSVEATWGPFLRSQAAAAAGLTDLSVAFGRVDPLSVPVVPAGGTIAIPWSSVGISGSGIIFNSGLPRQVTISDGGPIIATLTVAPDSDWPVSPAGYIKITQNYQLFEPLGVQTIFAEHPAIDAWCPVGSSPGQLTSVAFVDNDAVGANPAHWQAMLTNTTAADFTLGIDTSFALARVAPWVNF